MEKKNIFKCINYFRLIHTEYVRSPSYFCCYCRVMVFYQHILPSYSVVSLLRAFTDRKIVFDICFTGFGTALTTILLILFQNCYKYCYSDSRNL